MIKQFILFSTLTLCSGVVFASGYQLQEYSVTGLGRAMAGVGISNDDYSAVAFNPAGMNFTAKSGIQAGFIGVDLRSRVREVQPNDTKRDFTHIFRLLPHTFGQYKMTDKTTLGVGIYAPFGLATDYRNHWFANEQGQYSGITVANLTPALSYQLTDHITFGIGLNFQYASAHLTGGTPDGGWADMDDARSFNVGYIVGLAVQPWSSTRFGISYRSKIHHHLKGQNSGTAGAFTPFLAGTHNVHADITTPETVILSVAQDLGKKWTLSGTARWTKWSRFRDLTIYQDNIPSGPLTSVFENWKNTWFYAVGADYKYCKNLTFRFGVAYDEAAIKSVADRTVRIPDERRIWTSIGASYQKNNWQVDIGYTHLFIRQAVAEPTIKFVRRKMTWDTQSNILGVQFQYKF